jgi:hypothetical protein
MPNASSTEGNISPVFIIALQSTSFAVLCTSWRGHFSLGLKVRSVTFVVRLDPVVLPYKLRCHIHKRGISPVFEGLQKNRVTKDYRDSWEQVRGWEKWVGSVQWLYPCPKWEHDTSISRVALSQEQQLIKKF